jgi:phage terminase small subunit
VQDRSSGPEGLSRRQRIFLLEKLVGLNDKDAALAAGYSPSVAENTKQKIWAKPGVKDEFERLKYDAAVVLVRGKKACRLSPAASC